MKCLFILHITEFETRFFRCLRFSNRSLCFLFGSAQFLVVLASLLQHIYSLFMFRHVFKCKSTIDANATFDEQFLAYDLIIFDFGLMRRILGTTECIANYLDGGYMRFIWCLQHTTALAILLLVLIFMPKPVWVLWPALFMQSAFVLGMAVLTMATTPKILEALTGMVDHELGLTFTIYAVGVSLNWLFTFILWHFYWGQELRAQNAATTRRREQIQALGDKAFDANS